MSDPQPTQPTSHQVLMHTVHPRTPPKLTRTKPLTHNHALRLFNQLKHHGTQQRVQLYCIKTGTVELDYTNEKTS